MGRARDPGREGPRLFIIADRLQIGWRDDFGSLVWSIAIAGAHDGGAYVGGNSYGELMLGDQLITEQGAFLVRLDPNGDLLWSAPIVTEYESGANAVTTDRAGNVLFAGELNGEIKIGSTTLTAPLADPDALVAKLDAEGAVLWARSFDSGATRDSVRREAHGERDRRVGDHAGA
ncbi:hypothetical protein ACMHYB_47885 [Sorangium sp. So ce1128]